MGDSGELQVGETTVKTLTKGIRAALDELREIGTATDAVKGRDSVVHYEDLSPYAYSPETVPGGVVALAIGWLDQDVRFPVGDTSEVFREALAVECSENRHNKMRGWHRCALEGCCKNYPARYEVSGRTFSLGSAELRVVSRDQKWLIAPDLVLHYVAQHSYLPPSEFIEAVTARRSVPKG